MKSEWKTVQLSEVCELVAGYAFKSKDFGNYNSKVIKIAHITPPVVNMSNLAGVDITRYNSSKLEKYIARQGDYILAMTGATIGKIGRIESGSAYINQRILLFKPYDKIDSDYLYYVLNKREFTQYILNHIDSQSAQPNISASTVGKYTFILPDIQIQRETGRILRVIDTKCEVNREINDNLAELMQTVYQERFGFTGGVAECGILSDICSYSGDRVAVSKLNVNTYYSTENMLPEKAGATLASGLPTTPQTTACHKGDTLISNIRPYFKKIVYCENECGCSTDVLCFKPNHPKYAAYVFNTLYADKFFDFMVAGSKGTKMPRGDKQQIMTYPVRLPSESELDDFNSVAFPILNQIHSNKSENARLSALRDALISKLMSGEIDVTGIHL